MPSSTSTVRVRIGDIASGLPAIVVRGRKGGSAMAAAAVNALASERE